MLEYPEQVRPVEATTISPDHPELLKLSILKQILNFVVKGWVAAELIQKQR